MTTLPSLHKMTLHPFRRDSAAIYDSRNRTPIYFFASEQDAMAAMNLIDLAARNAAARAIKNFSERVAEQLEETADGL